MKNWSLVGLLCVTSPIYATSGLEHLYLKIAIKNNTPDAYVLVQNLSLLKTSGGNGVALNLDIYI